MNRLNNKVALITGAAKGMGEAEARLFAEEGASLIITDVDYTNLEKVASDLQALGTKVLALNIMWLLKRSGKRLPKKRKKLLER